MSAMRVVNASRSTILGTQVLLLDRWWKRLRGFLGRPAPVPGEGLILSPCRGIHMYGMRFPLDVVFIDNQGVVVALYPDLGPGTRTRLEGRAHHALELPKGQIRESGTELGDRVIWTPSPYGAGKNSTPQWVRRRARTNRSANGNGEAPSQGGTP